MQKEFCHDDNKESEDDFSQGKNYGELYFTRENESSVGLIGWVCPVCGRGLSPFTNVCPCKGPASWEFTITC